MYFADMHLEIFLADFAVFRVFWGISRDFAEIPEFRGSATARIIRSPVHGKTNDAKIILFITTIIKLQNHLSFL